MSDDVIDLQQRVEQIAGLAKERRNKRRRINHQAADFPVWPEAVRSAPNAILRSALFGVVRKGKRPTLDGVELVPCIKGVEIKVRSGVSLDQNDLDVWEEIIHWARKEKPGKRLEIPVKALLEALGRQPGKPNRQWLYDALERLYRCEIFVRMDKEGIEFEGALIARLVIEKGRPLMIQLDPYLPILWEPGWTRQNLEHRRALGQNQLAKWLHSFYGTHKKPLAYKAETLRDLCGSQTKELKKFRQQLKNASIRVAAVTGWQMILDENDLFHVIKHGPQAVDK